MIAYILLVVVFLRGGLVVTESISAPSQQACMENRPLIIADLLKRDGFTVNGGKLIHIDDVRAACLAFQEKPPV